MTLNLAAFSYYSIFLHFYKRTYFCLVTYGAAVEVDEGGDGHVFAEGYVGGDAFLGRRGVGFRVWGLRAHGLGGLGFRGVKGIRAKGLKV